MNTIYSKRTSCLFCANTNLKQVLEEDKELPLGCFPVKSLDTICHIIPYNVVFCEDCGTVQTKYVGDIQEVYGSNFAGLFGTTRNTMNILFADFVAQNETIQNILEIGAGNGEVCDMIVEKRTTLPYTIVDPCYWGKTENRIVKKEFFEQYNVSTIVDTVVMSHVFEHFYNPLGILKKIANHDSIQHIYLNWPNLEEFIRGGTYNVLNMEHIYYIENTFLEEIFLMFGFEVKRKYLYNTFAVFYHFQRTKSVENKINFPTNKNTYAATVLFFKKLFQFVEKANKTIDENPDLPVYIWPCSVHTSFCKMAGLNVDRLTNILDNSPEKIGNYQYGFRVPCAAFRPIVESHQPKLLLLVGGIYAKEVVQDAQKNKLNEIILL